MTRKTNRVLGIILGVALAALVPALLRSSPPRPGPMISECDGTLDTLVIQYVSDATFVVPVYKQFLAQLPREVKVYVQCPDRAAYDQLTSQLGPMAYQLHPLFVHHAMTPWSRDRWIALRPAKTRDKVTLVAPRGEVAADTWPQRRGDQQLAGDLARLLGDQARARTSDLYFDGGDLLADEQYVFLTPDAISRNVQQTVATVEELKEAFRRLTGPEVVLLEHAPRHHAGMFMMSIGNRRALVADPSLGRDCAGSAPAGLADPDYSPETQAAFDSVAAQLVGLGYKVARIPVVPSADGKTYLTYVNALIDHRGGKDIVYMPVYTGVEAMNDAAERVWREQGFEVRRIDCTTTFRHCGNLHCLVNVLRRGG